LHAAREVHPQADVRCLDTLEDTPGWFRSGYSWSYLFLVRHLPWVWKLSYRLLDAPGIYHLVQPLRMLWNLMIGRRFLLRLRQHPPDVVVTTHFFPTEVCATGKRFGWLRVPLVVVVTDLYPHRFWIFRECDAMVVGTPTAVGVCERRGVAREKLHLLGIPIDGAFAAARDRSALREQFQLRPGRHTALVTSGGTTVGQFERVVACLLELESALPERLQLLVVCGEDERAKQRLTERARSSPMPMQVFGFIDHMADVMAASDLIVAKAGGLTVAEAMGRGVPLIFYHVIPGQERMNADYVSRAGAGIVAQRPSDVAEAVAGLLTHPEQLNAMRRAADALGRPDAARAIVATAITPLVPHAGA